MQKGLRAVIGLLLATLLSSAGNTSACYLLLAGILLWVGLEAARDVLRSERERRYHHLRFGSRLERR